MHATSKDNPQRMEYNNAIFRYLDLQECTGSENDLPYSKRGSARGKNIFRVDRGVLYLPNYLGGRA